MINGGTHWSRPSNLPEWVMYWIGYTIYTLLTPIWVLCAVLWWKDDSMFILVHIEALFFNPWIIWRN